MSVTQEIGLVPTSKAAMDAVLKAMTLNENDPPVQVPQGQLRGCVCCQHSVASHFGPDGKWVGCYGAEADTVFVLVPATMLVKQGKAPRADASKRRQANGSGVANLSTTALDTRVQSREFRRARYFTALHHKANPEKLELSEARLKVLKAVHSAGREGVLSKAVMKRTKLPHGSIQQTLNWLRAHEYVKAQEDGS